MLNSATRNKIDGLWDSFWAGGISNPLTVIEQISYLLFIRRLDDREILRELQANRSGQGFTSIFPKKEFRWRELKHLNAEDLFKTVFVRFATVDCTKAGWLVKEKGIWSVTELGIEAYNKYPDPEKFYKEAVRLYHIWKRGNTPLETETTNIEESVTESNVIVTFEKAEEQAWNEIEEFIKSKNPYEFQDMVGNLLTAMGYFVAWIAPPGKDGGMDLLAWNDPLGTRPPRIKVQVKRYSDLKITVDTLRSFIALLGDDDVGIMISTSGFSKDAEVEARTQEKRKITLIDLRQFFDLWVKFYEKLSDSARSKMPLKQIWFLSPDR